MSRMTHFTCAVIALMLAFSAPVRAADAEPPTVDRLRAYLIWEDTGELSKNMAKTTDTIIANGENGSSVQMLVDVVLKAKPESLYDGEQPWLYVVAHSINEQPGDKAMLDTGFPLTFIGPKGELTRTVVVEHGCNGFSFEAYVMVGDKRKSEIKKDFAITCGD